MGEDRIGDAAGIGRDAKGLRPALSQSRRLRLLSVFVLYVAQGVPLGLFTFAIPAWMAANGASASDIAFVLGVTSLPWSLKLLNGFIMDRYTALTMGRRRVWLIGAQIVLIASLLVCAALSPTVRDVWLLAAIGFAVNLATTFQDVAVDGLAVDIMEEAERARASGMMFGGQAIGMATSTALSGATIVAYGPSAAYLLSALFIGLVTAFVLATRERPGERLLPWSKGEASAVNIAIQAHRWWPILRQTYTAVARPVSLIFLPVMVVKGIQYGVMSGATPLIATGSAGWAEGQITSIAGIGQMVAGLAGMTIGGMVGDKLGAKWTTTLFFGCWLALNATMFMAQPLWANSEFLTTYMLAWFSLDTLVTVAALPIAMRLCNRAVAATQFTLYMATANIGITMGSFLVGLTDKLGGLGPLFGLVALGNIIAIGIMLTVRFPTRQIDPEVVQQLPQGDRLVPAMN